jgi:hypothetical protein
MSAYRIKRKKKRKVAIRTYSIGDDEILVGFRVPTALGADAIARHLGLLFKFCFFENGRMLARHTAEGYDVICSFLSAAERDRVVANFEATPSAAALPQFEVTERTGWDAVGTIVQEFNLDSVADDPDLLESTMLGIAERMDQQPLGDDFLIPDLSPEEYARAKTIREQRKKSN